MRGGCRVFIKCKKCRPFKCRSLLLFSLSALFSLPLKPMSQVENGYFFPIETLRFSSTWVRYVMVQFVSYPDNIITIQDIASLGEKNHVYFQNSWSIKFSGTRTSLVSWSQLVSLLLVWKSEMIFQPHNEGKDEWSSLHQENNSTHPPRKERKRVLHPHS